VGPTTGVQFEDHPPKVPVLPGVCVAVIMIGGLTLMGYVPTQTEPPVLPSIAHPGPQWITFGVPVAEGAVTSQLVLFTPSL
jgi:hypothetical protein